MSRESVALLFNSFCGLKSVEHKTVNTGNDLYHETISRLEALSIEELKLGSRFSKGVFDGTRYWPRTHKRISLGDPEGGSLTTDGALDKLWQGIFFREVGLVWR
ncbi:hypothetical protein [Pajaroellobacter abortibovis]|uniref:hypothetical protein n=1 Tax=Pajaroellobacter abortibovis TaxID=1882918 RepID=UPI0012EBB877|nr:hypothetical protein [Pajaroellobacter abortibovis]